MKDTKVRKIRIRDYDTTIKMIDSWAIPEKQKTELKKFFDDLRLGLITGNEVSVGTIEGYLYAIKMPLDFLNKETNKITNEDVKTFANDLLLGKLTKTAERYVEENGKRVKKTLELPYSIAIRIKSKNIFKKFLEWKLGDRANKITKTLAIKTKLKQRTINYLSEKEINKLYKACRSDTERYIIAMLFDSGARIQEFINIRKNDIEMPSDNQKFVRIRLREEFSKTKGRTISLYWDKCEEAVKDFLQPKMNKLGDEDVVCECGYAFIRSFLYRIGRRVLDKKLNCHLFRHSSATYYASKLNRQQLCYRYGWRFSSPMPDVYINRDGMEQKELDEKFEASEITELKKELTQIKQQSAINEEQMGSMKEELMKEFKKSALAELKAELGIKD